MLVSKGDFARNRGVSAGRVSQWIAAGQISGDAIVGDGKFAKIDETLACEQLGLKLDAAQRHANGLRTNLTPVQAELGPETRPLSTPPTMPTADSLEQKLLAERLTKAQRDNRAAETEEALRLGQLCEAADARAATGREVSRVIARIEGSLADFASAIAAKFKVPHRDVLHELRGEWRKIRQKAAIEARERGEPMPETIGFDLDDQADA